VDSSIPAQYVYVEKIFLAQIACVEKTCEYRIQVLVPSSVHWTKDTLTRRSCNWKVDAAAVCRSFHPAVDPIQLVNLQRVYPGKDPMENNMTKKEMALTLLDRIERLESDRASLIAHLELIRYADQRQPDVNKIMSDHRVLDTVRARNVELRRSIALASDDTAAQTLLAGLLED
jgi:hypothetical protein